MSSSFGLDNNNNVNGVGMTQSISKVAICGGSMGSLSTQDAAKGADVYITSDIYYNTAQDMLSDGLLAWTQATI